MSFVTDRTLFYPEGGGQLGDQGVFMQGNILCNVLDTRSQKGVVLHLTDAPLDLGRSRVY